MTSNISFSRDKDKLFVSFEIKIKPLSSAEQVVVECEWTDYLQRIIDFGNAAFLRNLKYRLQMEET